MSWYDEHITHSPEVQGGAAVVVGTRTPVRSVVTLYCKTYPGDMAEVLAALPHLSEDDVRACLEYYRDHTDEIEADIARQNEALEILLKTS